MNGRATAEMKSAMLMAAGLGLIALGLAAPWARLSPASGQERGQATKAEGDKPAMPPASRFAPAADLAAEVDVLLAASARDLATADAFRLVGDTRNGQAAALASLLMVLALHDEDSKYRPVAGAALPHGIALARSTKYPEATEAWKNLQAALRAAPQGEKPKVPWSAPAFGEPLLYFIESRFSQIEKNLEDEALFRERTKETAQAAAVVAALGASMQHEIEYATTPAKREIWQAQSRAMRESAGKLSAAARGKDHAAALAELERLSQSCETCHEEWQVDQ
jgi:hypothetical protein